KGFSMAATEQPCLDLELVYARLGWLAYVSRFQPESYAAQLTREWALLAQLDDWCNRSIGNIQFNLSKATAGNKASGRAQIDEFRKMRQFLSYMSQSTEGQVRKVFREHPREAAEGLVKARFLRELKQAVNLLGALSDAEVREALEFLQSAEHLFLAGFARARLSD
ncbi:MAG: hypothetical protein QF473_39630, partial [Planctomycetota bacterium]|nr:hypothetical protein [Planctomycetota bacterium]